MEHELLKKNEQLIRENETLTKKLNEKTRLAQINEDLWNGEIKRNATIIQQLADYICDNFNIEKVEDTPVIFTNSESFTQVLLEDIIRERLGN